MSLDPQWKVLPDLAGSERISEGVRLLTGRRRQYSVHMRIPVEPEDRPVPRPTVSDCAARPLATWQTKRPWVWAILVGIGGALLTVFGVGFSQVRHLDPVASTYTQAAFVALSAVLGLTVMWRTRPSLADYGFRRPLHLDRTLWLLPLLAVPLVLAELVAITGSLWIGIVWHFVYDLATFSTGDELTTAALVGAGTTTAVLAAYAVWLWRRLPVDGPAMSSVG